LPPNTSLQASKPTGFDVRNKLCHWSFFKFKMKFELNIKESKGVDFF
jgi:hypothetical protein